jgi:hypothetical protein
LSLPISTCGEETLTKNSKSTSQPSEEVSQSGTKTLEETDGTSEEETDSKFIIGEDWNTEEYIFNSGSKMAVLVDETKDILDGMKIFEYQCSLYL